jgi:hypothetical protein
MKKGLAPRGDAKPFGVCAELHSLPRSIGTCLNRRQPARCRPPLEILCGVSYTEMVTHAVPDMLRILHAFDKRSDGQHHMSTDETLVTIGQEPQMLYWAKRLRCSPQELFFAVQAVGRSPRRLRQFLSAMRKRRTLLTAAPATFGRVASEPLPIPRSTSGPTAQA